MTSTETFTAPNGQARQATEKTADVIKQGVHQATERAGDLMAQLPKVDLNEGVTRYYEFVQQTVDLQRDLATKWAELLTSMSGSLREQAESFSHLLTEQTDKAVELTTEQADKLEQTAHEQADNVEQAEKKLAREAKRAQREQVKNAAEQTRARYDGLTKAELAAQLAERGLPKTGNVDELVERLVTADSN
jgi:uncharacterized phage infection (PIP) family protein YhgE